MKKTQYQIEREAVINNNGDLKKFEKDWHARACDAYRSRVKTTKDIHDFRSGKIKI